jgi:hypothetical protein
MAGKCFKCCPPPKKSKSKFTIYNKGVAPERTETMRKRGQEYVWRTPRNAPKGTPKSWIPTKIKKPRKLRTQILGDKQPVTIVNIEPKTEGGEETDSVADNKEVPLYNTAPPQGFVPLLTTPSQ